MVKIYIIFSFLLIISIRLNAQAPYAHMKSGCAETIAFKTLIGNSLAVTDTTMKVVHYDFTFETSSGKKVVKVNDNKITDDVIMMLKFNKPARVLIENIELVDRFGKHIKSPELGFDVKY